MITGMMRRKRWFIGVPLLVVLGWAYNFNETRVNKIRSELQPASFAARFAPMIERL